MSDKLKVGACHACGGTVSKSAKTCPHCGQKKPAKSGPTQVPKPIAWALIGFMLLTAIPMIFPGTSSTSTPTTSASSSNFSDKSKQQNWIHS